MSVLTQPRVVPAGAPAGAAAAPPSRSDRAPKPTRAGRSGSSGAGTIVLGTLLIVLGVVFLLRPSVPADWWHYGWPVFVLLPGFALFVTMAVRRRGVARLAVPACVVSMTGLIVLVQNTFDVWQTWAYAWALIFPTAVGLGQWLQGTLSRDPRLAERGRTLTWLGAAVSFAGAALFEGVANLSGLADGTIARTVGAAALILLGGALLLFRAPHPSDSR